MIRLNLLVQRECQYSHRFESIPGSLKEFLEAENSFTQLILIMQRHFSALCFHCRSPLKVSAGISAVQSMEKKKITEKFSQSEEEKKKPATFA